MFRSIVAAEKAAVQGENPDWDTQRCRDYQDEILSVRIDSQPCDEAYTRIALTQVLVKPDQRA